MMKADRLMISRRRRTEVAELLIKSEAGPMDSNRILSLRKVLWEGWRDVMRIRLGANLLCYSHRQHKRRPRD